MFRSRSIALIVLVVAVVACDSTGESADNGGSTLATTTIATADAGDSTGAEVATVTAMYEALNAYDADAYASYWAEDAEGWGTYESDWEEAVIGSPEMHQGFEEREAWGAQFTVSDCRLVDDGVRCLETWEDRIHGIAGVTIDREAIYTFDQQAMLVSMTYVNPNWTVSTDFWQEFIPWMKATYPETVDTYYQIAEFDTWNVENWFAPPENVAEVTGMIEEFVAQSDTYPLTP